MDAERELDQISREAGKCLRWAMWNQRVALALAPVALGNLFVGSWLYGNISWIVVSPVIILVALANVLLAVKGYHRAKALRLRAEAIARGFRGNGR